MKLFLEIVAIALALLIATTVHSCTNPNAPQHARSTR